jgi:hypothetical protein
MFQQYVMAGVRWCLGVSSRQYLNTRIGSLIMLLVTNNSLCRLQQKVVTGRVTPQPTNPRRPDRLECNAYARNCTCAVCFTLRVCLQSHNHRRFPFKSLSVHSQHSTVCSPPGLSIAPQSMYTTTRPCSMAAGCTTAATTKLHLQQQGVLSLAHRHSRTSSQHQHQQHACKLYNSRALYQQHSRNRRRQVGTLHVAHEQPDATSHC